MFGSICDVVVKIVRINVKQEDINWTFPKRASKYNSIADIYRSSCHKLFIQKEMASIQWKKIIKSPTIEQTQEVIQDRPGDVHHTIPV